jgi:hypothetical protein
MHQDPPQLTARPYYPLVVDFVIASPGTEVFITPESIVTSLASQLGIAAQTKAIVCFKLSRVDVYGMATASSSDRPSVELNCSSLTPQISNPSSPTAMGVSYGILKKLKDQGNLSKAAVCSYTWPLHMADMPLSSTTPFTVVSVAGNVANVLVRFHVLWSTTDIAAPLQ